MAELTSESKSLLIAAIKPRNPKSWIRSFFLYTNRKVDYLVQNDNSMSYSSVLQRLYDK